MKSILSRLERRRVDRVTVLKVLGDGAAGRGPRPAPSRVRYAAAMLLALWPLPSGLALAEDGVAAQFGFGSTTSAVFGDGFGQVDAIDDAFAIGPALDGSVGVHYRWLSVLAAYTRIFHQVGTESPYFAYPEASAYHQRVGVRLQASFCEWRSFLHATLGAGAGYGSFAQSASDLGGNEASVNFEGPYFEANAGFCMRPAQAISVDFVTTFAVTDILRGTGTVSLPAGTITTERSFDDHPVYHFGGGLRFNVIWGETYDAKQNDDDSDEPDQ